MPKWINVCFFGRYKDLLIFLTLLFVFRPYVGHSAYLAIWKLILTATLVAAIFNCHHKPIIKKLILSLSIPVVLLSWLNLLETHAYLFVSNVIATILFMLICAGSIIFDVVRRAKVTFETLRGMLCAYFLLAFLFAYIYYLISYFVPQALPVAHDQQQFAFTYSLSDMLYFSFIMLLTLGDSSVTNIPAQTVIVIEGIVGQFYIAILVAKIVAVYALSPLRMISILKKRARE
jgi:voltage-gated potassium channel